MQTNKCQKTPIVKTTKDNAATVIQKYFRGFQARKSHLPCKLYPSYLAQCKKTIETGSNSIPKAGGGKTEVYLPKEMPEIILKNTVRRKAISRFHQMQEVRSILRLQNSRHLIIPKASLCENFLVEQRLPINVDSFFNMSLYISDPPMFDEAVRELTHLFSKKYLPDLVNYQHDPLGHIDSVEDFVRYDNLPLFFIEENGKKVGKIGLIDLESIENTPNECGLETLVRIFPYHFDLIKEEATKLKLKMNQHNLEKAAEKGKKYLKAGFSDHFEWLKKVRNFRKLFILTKKELVN